MTLENNERILLLNLVKADIVKANNEKDPIHKWDGTSYKKPRRKYGLKKLTTLYEIESKLEKQNNKRKMFDDFYKWHDSLTTDESDEHSLTSAIETYFFKQ